MRFKLESLKQEFDDSPLLLQLITKDFEKYCLDVFGITITLTRILGTVVGDSGVHKDFRALDVRDEYDAKRTFTDEQVQELLKYVNEKYYRNDGKLTMIHHSFQGAPLHFHIQISTLTKTYMR